MLNRLFFLLLIPYILIADIEFDGIVGDSEWSDAEVYDLPFEINPSYNTQAEHETIVYIKNDSTNLYLSLIHI